MSQIAVLITHRTKPGQRDAVRAIWHRHMAPAVQANDGHDAYFYCVDPAVPDVVCAFQVYRDAAASAAFLTTAAYRDYEHEVTPLLLGPPDVKQLVLVWSKASPSI
ncbi:putative quinol monooxygenase [Cryobacterium sp. N21]|uniref:putative quinol monooxygenase n=1 Tax=Cryobacterium sp. N21 TaxID=2048289 RepID=UPI000CE4B47D|nr:antibiotic biosynthesis monooxygenase [Cryobacterium sp. N21]